jgi:hypothetical protein
MQRTVPRTPDGVTVGPVAVYPCGDWLTAAHATVLVAAWRLRSAAAAGGGP